MTFRKLSVFASLGFFTLASTASAQFSFLSRYDARDGSAEIVAFDPTSDLLFTGFEGGVDVIDFSNPAATPISLGTIDFTGVFGGVDLDGISAVAADPNGRGFGVASVIPDASNINSGKIVFFDPVSFSILDSVDVGFHPDAVFFSEDGSSLFVANEGEIVPNGVEAPGSLSIVDISGVTGLGSFGGLDGLDLVETFDFSQDNLADPQALLPIRSHNSGLPTLKYLDMEPENISQSGDKLFVTLQENNALGTFDLTTKEWSVSSLGTIDQLIDASDDDLIDGSEINIDDVVAGLPMADSIDSITIGGKTYLVTANEGDARPDDADSMRLKDAGTEGFPPLDPDYLEELKALYGVEDPLADEILGRLTVSIIDGDTDGDGDIDEATMFGTRSFSVWDADTGALVWDSGSFFEQYQADFDPDSWANNRSDNKGPEPEGIVIGDVFGTPVVFIGMERTHDIFAFDISNPEDPKFFARIAPNSEDEEPEGLFFVSAIDSPTGLPLLIVPNEDSETISTYSVVPEPGTIALVVLGAVTVAFVAIRRRRG